MFKHTRLILTAFILLAISVKAIPNAQAASMDFTFTDALGKNMKLSTPARRIVVVNSDAAEILCALDAGDQIIGVSDTIAEHSSNLLSVLKAKTVVGSSTSPSLEKIIELNPDLVIAYEMWMSKEAFEDKLAPLGIPVVRLYCYRVEHLDREIRILGRIAGREEKAGEYLHYLQNVLNQVQHRLEGLPKKVRIYAEGYTEFITYSRNSGADRLLEYAGVDNPALKEPVPFPMVTPEWVAVQNPEIIVKAASPSRIKSGYGVTDENAIASFLNDLMNRPSFRQLEAVKNGRVYLLSSEIWTGPRAPISILYIAKWCYPDRFKDMDPEAVHRDWLLTWHDKELKGIYVYP